MSMPMPQAIADWLVKLGLGQYTQRFTGQSCSDRRSPMRRKRRHILIVRSQLEGCDRSFFVRCGCIKRSMK
jgi:hypothetical protein